MKILIFILSLLSLIVAAALLVIAISSCASTAHAQIRAEWELLEAGPIDIHILETDGRRLYAGTADGVYTSLDHGYTWRLSDLPDYVRTIAITQNGVYAGTSSNGVFRSDSHGNTWQPKNNGIRLVERARGELGPPVIEQMFVTSSGAVIAVAYHQGTYISNNRGDTWHGIGDDWRIPVDNWQDWKIGYDIWKMAEFDGYLWAALSVTSMVRSPDNGGTWEVAGGWPISRVTDFAELNNRLYVATRNTDYTIVRWNEPERDWEVLIQGLPSGEKSNIDTFTVHTGRLFAGLRNHGVYMFDQRSETWIPVGLQEFTVVKLVSHQSELHAVAVDRNWDTGIYRASVPIVHSYGKASTTWGALKRE